jgi:transcription termination factor NusB
MLSKSIYNTFFELAELNDPDEKQEETAAKPKMVIKSIMTDRHVVNKAYKKMLENKKLKAIEEIEGTIIRWLKEKVPSSVDI